MKNKTKRANGESICENKEDQELIYVTSTLSVTDGSRPSPSRALDERIVSVTLCVTKVDMVCWMLPPEVKHVCLRAAAGFG